MRLPTLKMTIRQLLSAVMIVAFLLGFYRFFERWNYCRKKAAFHEKVEMAAMYNLSLLEKQMSLHPDRFRLDVDGKGWTRLPEGPFGPRGVSSKNLQEFISGHNRIKRKYLRASWNLLDVVPSE
jgi:hypothetical protein